MYINQFFELSMVLDHDRFHKVLKHTFSKKDYMEKKEEEYTDFSLEGKGIIVIYRDSQYKKKIKLIVNAEQLLNGSKPDPDMIVRKLNKHISEYFDFKYKIEDFTLSGMRIVTDIDVKSHEKVRAYLQVFHRIGKVKGFSPVRYECFEDIDSFCLDGNSIDISFLLYDLQEMCLKRVQDNGVGKKRLKSIVKASEGILRAEIHLTKPKAIRDYVSATNVSDQIAEMLEKYWDIFLEIFVKIVPFGDFYKKDKAVEIVRSEVKDIRLRRKMLRLLDLIPEKKSLYLAQKTMNCRNMEKIIEVFAEINVSPVTISKRQEMKYLECFYIYLKIV